MIKNIFEVYLPNSMRRTYQNRVDKPVKENYLNTSHGYVDFHIIRVVNGRFVQIIQNNLTGNSIASDNRYDLEMDKIL